MQRASNRLNGKERADGFVPDIKCPYWLKKEALKINFLFLFLPHKENTDVIRVARSWDLLCLCATGWGPAGEANVTRVQRVILVRSFFGRSIVTFLVLSRLFISFEIY